METCTPLATLWCTLGFASAMIFCSIGASYATARAGAGVCMMCVTRPEFAFKGLIPAAMAGILSIYGLIWTIIAKDALDNTAGMSLSAGYSYFAAGLIVGLPSMAAGYAIGLIAESGVKATAQQPKIFYTTLCMLGFCELIGLFGFIVGIILQSKIKLSMEAFPLCTPFAEAGAA